MFGSTVFVFLSLCAVGQCGQWMCDALDKIGEYLNRCNLDLFYDFLKIDFNYTIKLVLLVFLLFSFFIYELEKCSHVRAMITLSHLIVQNHCVNIDHSRNDLRHEARGYFQSNLHQYLVNT